MMILSHIWNLYINAAKQNIINIIVIGSHSPREHVVKHGPRVPSVRSGTKTGDVKRWSNELGTAGQLGLGNRESGLKQRGD